MARPTGVSNWSRHGPLLTADSPVWLRADNAYYCGVLSAPCRERAWDYSISVTDSRNKGRLLRVVQAMELADAEWKSPEPERREEDMVLYQPKNWEAETVYVVVWQKDEGKQGLLEPPYTEIRRSHADLALPEVVQQHRGRQGQESAQKGPSTDLGLHHPSC